jgi:hypothetical protein
MDCSGVMTAVARPAFHVPFGSAAHVGTTPSVAEHTNMMAVIPTGAVRLDQADFTIRFNRRAIAASFV